MLFSCSGNRTLSPDDFISWVEDAENGLNVKVESEVYIFETQFEPWAYRYIKDVGRENACLSGFEEWQKENNTLLFAKLRIASKDNVTDVLKVGGGGYEAFAARQYYCSFQINQDLSIISGGDTLPCVLSGLSQTYGAAPYVDVNLMFERKDSSELTNGLTLIFFDQKFSGKSVRFNFSKETILGIPEIKF